MLPQFLQSSYKAYKEDTDSIASGLASKAKQCGYPADLLDQEGQQQTIAASSSRLKGKARKQAKASKSVPASGGDANKRPTYTIKVKDFTTLADYVVASTKPIVQVPASIAKALRRSIKLREQHYSALAQTDDKTTQLESGADIGHLRFLGVLEQTQEILRSRTPPEILDDGSTNHNTATGGTDVESDTLLNKFEGLDVEEPSQDFLAAPNVTTAPGMTTGPTPQYEAEPVNNLQEEYLAAHCLFQDIKDIRAAVHSLWDGYLSGMDMVAISLSVETAITFVRDLEQDLVNRFPNKNDYENIVKVCYGAQCLHLGQHPETRERPDDLINFRVYDLAESVMMPTYLSLSSLSDIVEPDVVPVFKPGHFGDRNIRQDWSDMSPREKFRDDQIVMCESFSDLSLLASWLEKNPLAEDELTRGVRDMAPGKPIPIWLVFAAQCFLDAQHTLKRNLEGPHVDLQAHSNAIRATVMKTMEFHESLRVKNWPKRNDTWLEEQLRVIKDSIFTDQIGEKMKKIAVQGRLDPSFIEPYRLLKQHPVICGLFLFSLKMRFQEVSITFANAWGAIMYAGHLYNATRQERLLPVAWKDMEVAIGLQSSESFFVGDRPQGLDEYLKRFMLSMGYSASNFATNRRKQKPTPSVRGPKGLKELNPVARVFTNRYCNNENNVKWTRETLQPIIDAKLDDEDDNDNKHENKSDGRKENEAAASTNERGAGDDRIGGRGLRKRHNVRPKQAASGALFLRPKRDTQNVSVVDFLQDLVEALNAEAIEMTIDYLVLHRWCWMLLRNVNEACKEQLLRIYGGGYLTDKNELPWIVGYIFMAATSTSQAANLIPKKSGTEVTSQLLVTATGAIANMLTGDAGEIVVKKLKHLRLPMDFGELDLLEPDALI